MNDLENDLISFKANQSSVDDDFAAWHNIIMKWLNHHAPMKNKRVKSKRLPDWFTPEIIHMQKQRDNARKVNQWTEYKRYRNKIRQLIRLAKRKYFSDSINNSKDSKAIWNHLRTVNNKKQTSFNNLPSELTINGEKITDSEDVATKLNEYFSSIAEILNDHIEEISTFENDKLINFVNYNVPENTYFMIPSITCEQVLAFINKLDSTKATGIDGLGPRIIKMAASILSPSIAMLINKSILTGCFPSQLKLAKVFPIHKGGDKNDPSNYRPISILPTISKIFEKHVNQHLMGYLNKHKLIHESQSGFRRKHSCQTALVKLVDQWLSCIDKGDLIGTLFIDFRKAFDLVDHCLLINKLSLYKLSPLSLRWFQSYLSSRKQAVTSDVGLSEFAYVASGVPQGSILGPTLFLLFINDLPLFLNNCFADLFADDATFHTHSDNVDVIQHHLQTDLTETKLWSKRYKLPINYKKTTCMAVGTRQRLSDSRKIELKLDDVSIQNVSKQKLLGVYIDENLTWSVHIENLCSNISAKISLLRHLSEYVPRDVQKQFYQSYILPLIDYGSVIWGSTSLVNIDRLHKLQKRAARIILKADFQTPSANMFSELGWLPVPSRLKYNKAVLTYKTLNNMTPEYLSSLLKPVSQTHCLNLRSSENGDLHVPRARTTLYTGSFSFSAPKLWNSLPQSVRNCDTLHAFKKGLISAV